MGTEFTISALGAGDEALLKDFLYEAIHVPEGEEPPPRDVIDEPELAAFYKDWGGGDDLAFAAYHMEGVAAGLIWCRQFTDENFSYGYVDEETLCLAIAVSPDFRGRGLGSRLMKFFFDETKGRRVSLSVQETNRAVAFYKRHGFVEIDRVGGELIMVREGTSFD